eukprot:814549_1
MIIFTLFATIILTTMGEISDSPSVDKETIYSKINGFTQEFQRMGDEQDLTDFISDYFADSIDELFGCAVKEVNNNCYKGIAGVKEYYTQYMGLTHLNIYTSVSLLNDGIKQLPTGNWIADFVTFTYGINPLGGEKDEKCEAIISWKTRIIFNQKGLIQRVNKYEVLSQGGYLD